MTTENAKAFKQVKDLMLAGNVAEARKVICAAAKITDDERREVGEENLPHFILQKTKNINIARMLQVERAFNTVYRAFSEPEKDFLKEKAWREMEQVEPLMSNPEKLEVYYWKGKCAAVMFPDDQQKAVDLFEQAIAFSPYNSKSDYLRYAIREVCSAKVDAEEKLRYTEMACRKMHGSLQNPKYDEYIDGLKRVCYNQALRKAKNQELQWYEREGGYMRALELMNEVRIPAAEKYQHRIRVYGALYQLYQDNGETQKAGQMHKNRQAAINAAAHEKKLRTGVRIDSSSHNYR